MSTVLNSNQPAACAMLLHRSMRPFLEGDGGHLYTQVRSFVSGLSDRIVHRQMMHALRKDHTRQWQVASHNPYPARKLALVTGATSGIGKAFAMYFAEQGFNLILTGRRRNLLLSVASELRNRHKINVEMIVADLSRNEDLSMLLKEIERAGPVDILVNNAGYGMDTRFSVDDIDHQMAMLKVHVNAPLLLTHKVLPSMMERQRGIIINVSSLAALMPTAGNTMYTSTKSFLKNFSESLHMDVYHYGIKIQCLCPGFTHSDFHKNLSLSDKGRNKVWTPWMEPRDVVAYSVRCLKKGTVICVPGFYNRMIRLLVAGIPRSLYYLMAERLERQFRPQPEITSCAA